MKDDEIFKIYKKCMNQHVRERDQLPVRTFARAIEAAVLAAHPPAVESNWYNENPQPSDCGDDMRPVAHPPAQDTQACAHRIVDIRNDHVESGYMCVDCNAVFAAADHAQDTQDAKDAG